MAFENMGKVMERLITRLLDVKGGCPECSGDLYGWKGKNPDGSERCQPTCMNCGYVDLKRKEDIQTAKIYNKSLRDRAIAFFETQSIIPDSALKGKKLSDYKMVDEETRRGLQVIQEALKAILNSEPIHVVLSGKSGSGKSHLAMGLCKQVLSKSNFDKKCIFVSYRELLEQIKFSFSDEQLRKDIQGSLMADLKTADLVILDDLGSELGGVKAGNSTTFNNDTLNAILEARQNRALVVTTNLTSAELSDAYGQRILSRISQNSKGYTMTFENTSDKRMNGI